MAVPSMWSPPVYPDFHACDHFYGSQNNPTYLDCQVALRLIMPGSENETWYIGMGTYGIPQIITYHTCQIQLLASGPAAHFGQSFTFARDKVRNMAGWVIDQCVGAAGTGGFVTAGLSNASEYVAEPDTFYEDPFPDYTTFLNVLVGNSDSFFAYNPGDMDPTTGTVLLASIVAAYAAEPDTSPLKPNIERNYEFYQPAVFAMRRGSMRTWWQGPQHPLTNSSAANLTDFMNNLTLPTNVTLPANLTLLGSKSTSVCAGTGQEITTGCGSQDKELVTTS